MMPTMTTPAYWRRELLKMPEVRLLTLKIVSMILGSPTLYRSTGSVSGSSGPNSP